MKRGRKALTPLQKQIDDSLGIPWTSPHPMEQVIYGFWLAVRQAGPDECCLACNRANVARSKKQTAG